MDIYSSPISKFMTKKVITSKVSSTIKSACKSMYDNNVGCLVIVKQTIKGIVPVGIITERDLVKNSRFHGTILSSHIDKRIYVISINFW